MQTETREGQVSMFPFQSKSQEKRAPSPRDGRARKGGSSPNSGRRGFFVKKKKRVIG